jgi:hypothetical protein
MSKRRFRFSNGTTQNRSKSGKPVWLWKWTADAWHTYKQKRKDGKI